MPPISRNGISASLSASSAWSRTRRNRSPLSASVTSTAVSGMRIRHSSIHLGGPVVPVPAGGQTARSGGGELAGTVLQELEDGAPHRAPEPGIGPDAVGRLGEPRGDREALLVPVQQPRGDVGGARDRGRVAELGRDLL